MGQHNNRGVVIESDLYGLEIGVFQSAEAYKAAMKKLGYDSQLDYDPRGYDALALVEQFDGLNYYALVITGKDYGLIGHECLHMTDYVLGHKGIPLDAANTETKAYFFEWLFNKVLDALDMPRQVK